MFVTPGTSRWPETATSGTWTPSVQGGVNCYQTFHRPLLQHERIFLDEFAAVAVAHDKVEVALREQMILNPGHDQGRIPFANFRHDHANGVASLLTK
jgi:hypothetical protein